jgi:hypothetical protein
MIKFIVLEWERNRDSLPPLLKKEDWKIIERASLSPKSSKRRCKGNRESVSKPEIWKKE